MFSAIIEQTHQFRNAKKINEVPSGLEKGFLHKKKSKEQNLEKNVSKIFFHRNCQQNLLGRILPKKN